MYLVQFRCPGMAWRGAWLPMTAPCAAGLAKALQTLRPAQEFRVQPAEAVRPLDIRL